ncbi:hypothetical protein CMI47_22420 [Candidatus Pacearchaeota archaeon]|nr:hypothetical protein [Candidatus Pacearchaeota archaeon]|tara:strand:+ start:375 stop:1295 length:921 start_codon:yes stop_codon:yes gene_type:complete
MKIGFFSEAGYEGKVPRNHPNMRTDVAWVCALNATHHPLPKIQTLPDNLYDVGVMILPKKREMLLKYPLLEQYRRVCKKVTVMQESYYNYWQDSPIAEQIWYFNFIASMDLIFCHNDIDLKYYNGLTNVRTELLPSVMITDDIVCRNEWGDATIIGGNWVRDYGGFDSYQVASELGHPITAVTTGRMKPEEEEVLNHIPWVMWREWIDILSQFNVGVQLGTASAGTFNLNCSFHGIPCIGYFNVNTQKILHPLTTVEVGEIDKAKEIANKLKDDNFYKLCMETTLKRYENYYSEKVFVKHWNGVWK